MKAIVEDDLVVGIAEGDVPGHPIPDELAHLPAEALAFKDGKVIDVRKMRTFYIDEQGRRHIYQHNSKWKRVNGAYDAPLSRKGNTIEAGPSEMLRRRIKGEASRRTRSILGDLDTQIVMLSQITEVKGAAKAKLTAAFAWKRDMLARAKELIEAEDQDYADDNKWPKPPAGVAEIADEF